jgi:hypothetical protein
VATKATPKGVAKGGSAGSKKKKSTQKYTIDCTHPVEDGIMDPANFVSNQLDVIAILSYCLYCNLLSTV